MALSFPMLSFRWKYYYAALLKNTKFMFWLNNLSFNSEPSIAFLLILETESKMVLSPA